MFNATAELFESLIGQDVSVAIAGGTEPWRITGVTRRNAHALRSEQPFNLYLSAPASDTPRQGMRTSVLPNGESFAFFAVPLSATADSVDYEVIFN